MPPALRGAKLAEFAMALVGVLIAVGCGGDGGNGGLTAEEFRQQADAICAEFEGKLDAVEQPSSPEEIERFVDEAVPIIEEGTQKLSDLEPPEEFRDEWTRVTEINAENLDTIKEVQAALQDGDVEESQRLLQEAGGNEEEADRLARDIGLTKCGQDTA